jgi:hypothetical protein
MFNIHKFYVLPTQCIYVFCMDLRTNSDFFPNTVLTDWFVWLTRSVFTAQYDLNLWLEFYFSLWNRVMAQAVSGQGSIPGQSMWDLKWTMWHWDRFFFEYFRFLLSVSFHQCSIFIFIYLLLLPKGQTGAAWEPSKTMLFRKSRSIG